jgi:hypothetical protein
LYSGAARGQGWACVGKRPAESSDAGSKAVEPIAMVRPIAVPIAIVMGRCRRSRRNCETTRLLRLKPYWLWLRCDACGHRVAVALVPFRPLLGRRRVVGRAAPECALLGVRTAWGEPSAPVVGRRGRGVGGVPFSASLALNSLTSIKRRAILRPFSALPQRARWRRR